MSPEYAAALAASNAAHDAFQKIRDAYRNREIGDAEYLAGRAIHDAARAAFDVAFAAEQDRADEPTEADADAQPSLF